MAGSGGGNAVSTQKFVDDAVNLVLVGGTDDEGDLGRSWTNETDVSTDWTKAPYAGSPGTPAGIGDTGYASNPSALRFIIEQGLTDVGGNPFEGISAFDAQELIDEMKDRYISFNDIIEAYSPTEEWSSYLTEALDQDSNVVPELDVDALVSAIVSLAISRAASLSANAVNNAQADKKTQLDETQLRQLSEATKVLNTLAPNAQTQANSFLSNVANLAFSLAQAEGDVATVDGLADAETALASMQTNVLSVANTIQDGADAKSKSITGGREIEADAVGSTRLSRVGDSTDLAIADAGDVLADARTDAKLSASTILASLDPNTEALVSRMYVLAMGNTTSVISSAIAQASEVVDSEVVDGMVEAFKAKTNREHFRAVNRTAGGFADINAVMSSAFVFAMAGMESDYTKTIAAYRSEMNKELYTQVLRSYIELFSANQGAYLNSYAVQLEKAFEAYRLELPLQTQVFATILPQYVQVYLNTYGEYLRTYLQGSALYGEQARNLSGLEANLTAQLSDIRKQLSLSLAQIHMGTMSGLTELEARTYVGNIAEELKLFDSLMRSRLGTSTAIVSDQLGNTVRSRLTESSLRSDFVGKAIDTQQALKGTETELNRLATVLLGDIDRQAIIAFNEENDKNIEYDINSAGWDMSLFQQIGNIASSASGSVVPMAGKMSRSQTAMAGGFSGAAVGTSIGAKIGTGVGGPGTGTAIGAGAGALIGGVAGIIQGYQGQ